VIEIELAHEILVGLLPAELRHRLAGGRFKELHGRVTGRALRSSPLTLIWLASPGVELGRYGWCLPPSLQQFAALPDV
jgi:hypothetical protein